MSTENQEPEPVQTTQPSSTTAGARGAIPTSTLILAAILLAVVGFGAGYAVGHHVARSALRFPRFEGRMGSMPRMGGGAPGSWMPANGVMPGFGEGVAGTPGERFLAGTVTGVQGDSFSVRTFRGETVTVSASSTTFVRLAAGTSIAELVPGTTVIVAGIVGADGTFAASHVVQLALPTASQGAAPGYPSPGSG
jgi:hypothetical protein